MKSWLNAPSLYTSWFLLASLFFYWDLVDCLVILWPIVYIVSILAFIGVFVGSGAKAIRTPGGKWPVRFQFVLLNLAVALIAFLPLAEIKDRLDFWLNLQRRQAVIQMVKDHKLSENVHSSDLILPSALEDLSKNGKIERLEFPDCSLGVRFFTCTTFRGYRAFVYTEHNYVPIDAVEKLAPNWYLVWK